MSRTTIQDALELLNKQHQGKLVPEGSSLKSWSGEESHCLKQMLVLIRVTEYRSKEFSRHSDYSCLLFFDLFDVVEATVIHERLVQEQKDLPTKVG